MPASLPGRPFAQPIRLPHALRPPPPAHHPYTALCSLRSGSQNDVLGAATVSATEADEAAAAAKGEQSQRERRQHVAVGAEPGPELADTLTQKQREARDRALHPMQVGAQGGSRPLFYADPGDSDFDEDLDADLDV